MLAHFEVGVISEDGGRAGRAHERTGPRGGWEGGYLGYFPVEEQR